MAVAHVLGAMVGFGVTCFKNNLQYLSWYRKPWEHVISGTAGAYAFAWIAAKEDEMVKRIEEYYEKNGVKPASK